MSKPDFDFSLYFEVPDEWIESALNIPNAVNTRPKVLPIRRYVAAASIVLVVALGISVFFLFGNKNPISIAPTPKTDSTGSVTPSPSFSEIPTEAESQTDSTLPQGIKREAETQLSTDAQGHAIIISAPPVTRNSNATTPPTADVSAQKPTDAVLPPRETSPGNPIVKPAVPTQPKAAPTSPSATQQPISTNTEPTEMDPPTELPWIIETPTEAGYEAQDALVLKAELTNRIRLNEKYVYCRIHKSTGELIGDKDLYAWQHRVTVNRNYKIVTYEPSERNLYLAPGNYVYYFYESNGDIFADGSFTIN